MDILLYTTGSCFWTGPRCNARTSKLSVEKSTTDRKKKSKLYHKVQKWIANQGVHRYARGICSDLKCNKRDVARKCPDSANFASMWSIDNAPYFRFCLQQTHRTTKSTMIPCKLQEKFFWALNRKLKSLIKEPARSYELYLQNSILRSWQRILPTSATQKSWNILEWGSRWAPEGDEEAITTAEAGTLRIHRLFFLYKGKPPSYN